jgi:undecaprenyl-diphosphatase
MRRRRRAEVTPHDGWTSHVSSGLALAGFLFFVLVGFTVLAMGPLASLDAYFNVQPAPPGWLPFLHVLDRIGQRAVCLPLLAVITLYCCRRQESWRPAWIVAVSVFSLNLFVLILKVGLGRAEPRSADPSFFEGGMAYPSGHTSNIVLVYGLCVFLLGRYGGVRRPLVRLMWAVVVVLSVVMVVTSLTLRWHWFADLIAGLLSGGIVLTLTEALDAAVPDEAVEDRVRRLRRWWRTRSRRGRGGVDEDATKDEAATEPLPEEERPPALGRPG